MEPRPQQAASFPHYYSNDPQMHTQPVLPAPLMHSMQGQNLATTSLTQHLPNNASPMAVWMLHQQHQLALQTRHIQQQQQQQQRNMINMIYRNSLNQQLQPPPIARTIIDLVTIAPTLDQLVLPPVAQEPPFISTMKALPPHYQDMLHRVTALKFDMRPATPDELRTGEKYTKNAKSSLDTLQHIRPMLEPFKNYHKFLVVRCRCCATHRHYVKGSTNYIHLGNVVKDTFARVLQDRMLHLMSCPTVPEITKSRIADQVSRKDSQGQKAFSIFVAQWSEAVVAAHFSSHSPNVPKPALAKKQKTYEFEPISKFDGLSDAVALASRIARNPIISFDDMADKMATEPAPIMELFSRLYQLRVQPCHETSEHKVDLLCSTCDRRPNLTLSALVSREPLPPGLGKRLGDFAVTHADCCQSASPAVRRMFLKRARPVDEVIWHDFCRVWQSYLTNYFRSCGKPSLSKLRRQRDHFRPITVRDSLKEPYASLPFYSIPNPEPPYIHVLHTNQDKFIIVDNELYRDLAGNRWFRREISKHRSTYLQASTCPGVDLDGNPCESQQEEVAREVVNIVADHGYIFLEVCRSGGGTCIPVSEERQKAFVTNCLRNGFSELLRPPKEPCSNQNVVFDLEYAPMVGLLDGDIVWKWQEVMRDKKVCEKQSLVLDKNEVEATRLVWSKKQDLRLDDIVHAINKQSKTVEQARGTSQREVVTFGTRDKEQGNVSTTNSESPLKDGSRMNMPQSSTQSGNESANQAKKNPLLPGDKMIGLQPDKALLIGGLKRVPVNDAIMPSKRPRQDCGLEIEHCANPNSDFVLGGEIVEILSTDSDSC